MAPGANHYEASGAWDDKSNTLTYKLHFPTTS